MQPTLADRFPAHILAVQVGLNRPARQSRNPATTRHQLKNRNGQLGCSARRIDVGRAKHIANQIQAFIGNRVRHEDLVLEILSREICLAGKWVPVRKQSQNLIAKQRMVDHAFTFCSMRNDDQVGAVFAKKPDRIGVKPRD